MISKGLTDHLPDVIKSSNISTILSHTVSFLLISLLFVEPPPTILHGLQGLKLRVHLLDLIFLRLPGAFFIELFHFLFLFIHAVVVVERTEG